MAKIGKRMKKENESLIWEKDILERELCEIKRYNSELEEKIKELGEDKYDALEEELKIFKGRNEELEVEMNFFEYIEKRFTELEEGFKLFVKVEKRNIDLEESLKELNKENNL